MDEENRQEALDEDAVQTPCGHEGCMLKTFKMDAQSF